MAPDIRCAFPNLWISGEFIVAAAEAPRFAIMVFLTRMFETRTSPGLKCKDATTGLTTASGETELKHD
jgi:hypothetical protein